MPAAIATSSPTYVLTFVLVLLVLAAIAYLWCTAAASEEASLHAADAHEPFYSCPNCGTLNAWGCADCRSCGVCTTPDGRGECVVGDRQGPFFREDCVGWTYGGRCEAGYCRGVAPPSSLPWTTTFYRPRPRSSWWSRVFAPWSWRGGSRRRRRHRHRRYRR